MNLTPAESQIGFNHKKEVIAGVLYNKLLQIKMKRLIDIGLSLLLIIIFSPIFIVIAILIGLSSKGPILYTNQRIGLFGQHFSCLKFRSMVTEQHYSKEDLKAYVDAQNQGILFKPKQDNRVTQIGKIIRKTSIDELPQLFNVLKGEMSIVGPRPLVPFMLDNLDSFNEIRSLLKPGITGKWQIENRFNNTSATFMIEPDINYITSFSIINDIKIVLKTPKIVLAATGAH